MCVYEYTYSVELLLSGRPDVRPPPLERPLDNVNLNINVLISNPDERPLRGETEVSSQEGVHCIYNMRIKLCMYYEYKSSLLCQNHLALAKRFPKKLELKR